MTLRIRIAGDKKPKAQANGHRDFSDFERSLNKLTTSQDFIDYFMPEIDPYALKAMDGEKFNIQGYEHTNPFRYMAEHRLKEICKFIVKTPQWQRDEVDPILNIARWVFTIFKDTTHLSTSECLALAIEAQNRINKTNPNLIEWLEDDNLESERSAKEVTTILHSVISEFPQHWNEWMNQLESSTFKRHRKIENDPK